MRHMRCVWMRWCRNHKATPPVPPKKCYLRDAIVWAVMLAMLDIGLYWYYFTM